MSLYGSFARDKHFSELDTPLPTAEGVLTPAQRKARALFYLGLNASLTGGNFTINSSPTSTDNAGRTVRLNSITNTGTANSFIGFQSKPRQGVSMANNVIGAEVGASISDGVALTGSGSIIGLHSDVYLRGTAAGTIAGDVRGHQIELVTDDAGTRTITGKVVGLRMRAAFSATTVTSGVIVPFSIERMEAQTGSQSWTHLFELPGAGGGAWNNDPTTENDGALQGYIKVLINGVDKYIRLYAVGATAD